jgi:hypothetical protein
MNTLWNVHGNAQVTAYGASFIGDVHGNSAGWTDDTVTVHCFDDLGHLTDATFTVLLAKPTPIRDGAAHVFADQPTTASHAPDPGFLHDPDSAATSRSPACSAAMRAAA